MTITDIFLGWKARAPDSKQENDEKEENRERAIWKLSHFSIEFTVVLAVAAAAVCHFQDA